MPPLSRLMAHVLNTFYCTGALGTTVNLDTIRCVWTGEIHLNTLREDGDTCGLDLNTGENNFTRAFKTARILYEIILQCKLSTHFNPDTIKTNKYSGICRPCQVIFFCLLSFFFNKAYSAAGFSKGKLSFKKKSLSNSEAFLKCYSLFANEQISLFELINQPYFRLV